jgi:CubicO group peptidase (beta-lactamase class C family)
MGSRSKVSAVVGLQARRFPAFCAALLLAMAVGAASPRELPTNWEAPPGDRLEHETAGFAKILCSAIFVTGRKLKTAVDEDGFFVSPRASRSKVVDIIVDRQAQEVRLTLSNGISRSARLVGDQGCVTLPRGVEKVYFTPVRVKSALPAAATQDWPMGDRLPDSPLPPEIDEAKLKAGVMAAFDPKEALTAAFVVVYKGRLIAERYQEGLDHATRLPSWSMGKSITATLMGLLIQKGVYDLWQPAPVADWQGADDPRRMIRIADLLRMSSGLRFVAPQDPDYDPGRGYPDHLYVYTGAIDAYHWSITRPPQWPPNTVGRYRNSDPLIINYLIRRAVTASGEEYLSYPQRRLFDRLGIRHMLLETDPYGNFLLNGYELGTGRDWARLGMLYLQDGVWNGERLLPEGFVNFVRTPAPAWSEPVYGGFFWLNRTGNWPLPEDAYMMAGAGGQHAFIVPTHDLVVVRLGHYKGSHAGSHALRNALQLLMEAVPQVRPAWQPPKPPSER